MRHRVGKIFGDQIKILVLAVLDLIYQKLLIPYLIQPFYPTSPKWASVVDYLIGSKTIFPTGNRRLFWMDMSPPQLGCLRSPSRVYFGPPTFHHLHGPNYQFISIERL